MNWHAILLVISIAAELLALAGTAYVVILAIVGFSNQWAEETEPTEAVSHTRFLVLIPAHNEEERTRPTLESLRVQDYPAELRRMIVVADNCQDQTANVVRRKGFECWERIEPAAPGKGRALRWAINRLGPEVFDAVVFVDADTRLCPGFFADMDRQIQQGVSALQSRNEFELVGSSYFSLLSYASKRAENDLYWRGRERLGLMGFLSGNGFCLKREVLERFPWSAYSIVEDIEYSLQLTLQGVRVKFLESARVLSRPTSQAKDAYSQRLRWASGTLQVMKKYVPKLLRASLAQRSFLLAEAALALVMTSRLFLLYLVAVAGVCSLVVGLTGDGLWLAAAVLANVILLAIYAGMVLSEIPQVNGGRWRALLTLPFYLGWITLVHLAAALRIRRNAWGRVSR
jgi:1,2-diacylglycerol 3-beta-glucosyltransferase